MTNQLNIRAFGIEPEFGIIGMTHYDVNDKIRQSPLAGKIKAKKDYSGTTEFNLVEIDMPPLALCNAQEKFWQEVYDFIISIGGFVNKRICSTHVHISASTIKDGITATEFTEKSIANWHSNRSVVEEMFNSEKLDPQIVWDILFRMTNPSQYGARKDMMSLVPNSRRPKTQSVRSHSDDGYYCQWINHNKLLQCDKTSIASIRDCQQDSKFSEINLSHWDDKGTIEFRQHGGTLEQEKITNWCKFLLNIFVTSIETRFDHSETRTVTAPTVEEFEATFDRTGTRQVKLYRSILGLHGGMSVRDIHLNVGTRTDVAVRRLISDMTRRLNNMVGTEQLMVCHTQRTNGGRYRDGTDISSYEILETSTINGTGVTPKPENRTGNVSIWSNCPDVIFEYQHTRIEEIARQIASRS